MTRSNRAGEDKTFADYYEQDALLKGSINGIEYQIYKIRDTHYSVYVHLPRICPCIIETHSHPLIPVRENINFGPTEDNWVGFTTNGISEYNYDKNWKPLDDDRREEPKSLNYFDHKDISRWTPRLLESAVTDWIQKMDSELDEINMQCSH